MHSSSWVLRSLKTQGGQLGTLRGGGRPLGGAGPPGPRTGLLIAVGGPRPWGGQRPQAALTHRNIPVGRGQGRRVTLVRRLGHLSWVCPASGLAGGTHLASPGLAGSEPPLGLCGQRMCGARTWPPGRGPGIRTAASSGLATGPCRASVGGGPFLGPSGGKAFCPAHSSSCSPSPPTQRALSCTPSVQTADTSAVYAFSLNCVDKVGC